MDMRHGGVAAVLTVLAAGACAQQASITALEGFPKDGGGIHTSVALGVSADGAFVVGISQEDFDDGWIYVGCQWDAAGNITRLPNLDGGEDDDLGTPVAVSTAGDAVGYGQTSTWEACRWIGGIPQGLGFLGSYQGSSLSQALATTPDGAVIIGVSTVSEGYEAFRWTPDNGMEGLGDHDGGPHWSAAQGISPAGDFIVGSGHTQDGIRAALWHDGELISLGVPPGADHTYAYGVSSGGCVVAGTMVHPDGTPEVVRWVGGQPTPLGHLPNTLQSFANGISADGQVIVGHSSGTAYVWTPASGMRSLKAVLETDHGLDLSEWDLRNAYAVTPDGSQIVGVGRYGSQGTVAFRVVLPRDPDTDGDGLLDDWEINGVPFVAGDGSERRLLLDVDGDGLSDADPLRKDLFVELDSMAGLGFPQDAIDLVRFAFADAPVENPACTEPGIKLHVLSDDDSLPFETNSEQGADGWPVNAASLRAAWFGTLDEQSDPDRAALLEAKAKAFRYCIVMNRMETQQFGSPGGIGELGGDDFIVFADSCCSDGLSISFAAVFMHELGHNLGLRHGGGDDINGKPNYPSVMNYTLQYSRSWNAGFWRLDYSREELATLKESCLDETAYPGSVLYADHFMPYYTLVPFGADCYPEDQHGTAQIRYLALADQHENDFDSDCTLSTCATEDLNYFEDGNILPGSGEDSPGDTLRGHNDWAAIVLPVRDGGGAYQGDVPGGELTDEQARWMEDNFPPPPGPCAADFNGDGDADTRDVIAFLGAWADGDGAADFNSDGEIDSRDVIAFLNAWAAGC